MTPKPSIIYSGQQFDTSLVLSKVSKGRIVIKEMIYEKCRLYIAEWETPDGDGTKTSSILLFKAILQNGLINIISQADNINIGNINVDPLEVLKKANVTGSSTQASFSPQVSTVFSL